jgi:PAS domain S-box-containing protein
VWWAFLPYAGSLRFEDPKYVVSTLVFLAMGVALSKVSVRVRRANRDAALALAQAQRAEDAAREAEEGFRALVNNSAQIVWTTDAEGTVVEDSPSWRAFTGQTYEEWKGGGWIDAIHPEDRERTAALWRDAIKAKTAVATEYRLHHVRGEWRWTSARGVPLLRADGSVKKWVGMNTDITAGKHAEAALQESETEQHFVAQVATILASTINYEETLSRVANLVVRDLADCCIIDLVGEDGKVRRPKVVHRDPAMNPVMLALERIDLDSKRPHLASDVLVARKPFLLAEVTAEYLASVAQGDEHRDALRKLAPKSIMAIPLMEGGQLLGALLFIRTSSNAPYKANDLRLAEELGRRAALAVHHARLYGAAQRATEAREEILRIVAHDLRNPLNIILMQAALLQGGRPEGERRSRRPGDTIHRSALRMNRLIQNLLDVACIEAGQFSVERGLVTAEQVVLEVTEAQRALVTSAGLELKLDVAHDLPAISVDRERLLQVFENLIGNAVKFTPAGGRVTVGATQRDGAVLFWVENTGPIIPAEQLPHLFDRFWQARKGEHRGVGLGLSIVKGIVEIHGGQVWAESTAGRGTTLYFTVPGVSGAEASKAATLH